MLRTRSSLRFARHAIGAAAAASLGAMALAQPAGLTAIHGSATVHQQGTRTTVTTTNGAGTSHSALDWRSFQVPGGTTTFFAQPNAASTSINRVTGGDPSAIFGTLGSNGRLVLVNPAGIAVGAGAVVDTAGFTASTLQMSRADAIAGRLRFGDGAQPGASLQVQGQVLARGGDVVLIGPQVEAGAQAAVESIGGDVVLAAGRKVELTGRGLEGIRMEVRAPGDRALNLGKLQGDSVGMFAGQLRHSGLIQASSAKVEGGRVVLQATGAAEVAGRIVASRADRGGSVHLTADHLVLRSATVIDASHARGGGEVLVGGGWQGRDARIANARQVDVEAGALLKADATLAGQGGVVVVWSDGTTRFSGHVSARGAGPQGHGGRAEVSGRGRLVFRGGADLGGPQGRTGSLLLDPDDVTIRGGSPGIADGLGDVLDPGADTFYESQLEALDADITIQAGKKIEVRGTFGGGELLVMRDRNLTMQLVDDGGAGIDLRGMPIRTQGSGSVLLQTQGQKIEPDRITTAGGTIRLQSVDGDVRADHALDAAGGAIFLAGKKVDLGGRQDFASGTVVTVAAANHFHNDGTVVLRSGATLATGGGDLENKGAGVLEGEGHLDLGGGTLVNEGIVRPGGDGTAGVLRVTGGFEQKKGGRLEIDVAGGASHDSLQVSGNARLDGRLALAARGYTPAPGDSYAVLQAGSVTSRFEQVEAPGFAGFAPVYEAARVRFATAAAPAPAPTSAPAPAPAPAPTSAPAPAPTSAPAPAPASPAAQAPAPAPAPAPAAPGASAGGDRAAPRPAASVAAAPSAPARQAAQQTANESNSYLAQGAPDGDVLDPRRRERRQEAEITAVACRG